MYRFYLCAIFMMASAALAHPGHEEPTVEEYDIAFKHYAEWSKNIANPDFYKDLEFGMLKDGEQKVKFTELKEFEKNLFYLYQAENLSNRLFMLQNFWQNELKKLQILDEQPIEAPDPGEEVRVEKPKNPIKATATIKDVEGYLFNVYNLRKAHAYRYETLINYIFDKFKDEIPETDRDNYLDKVRTWHDKQQLINRSESPSN